MTPQQYRKIQEIDTFERDAKNDQKEKVNVVTPSQAVLMTILECKKANPNVSIPYSFEIATLLMKAIKKKPVFSLKIHVVCQFLNVIQLKK